MRLECGSSIIRCAQKPSESEEEEESASEKSDSEESEESEEAELPKAKPKAVAKVTV